MSLRFTTTKPKTLLDHFKKQIEDGHVVTWSYDKDGDFTHVKTQWENLAWLRPQIKDGYLLFTTITPKDENISTEVYAIYHGRFIESILSHCDKFFTNVVASAFPTDGDKV